jgi:hypothetical protein
MPDSVNSGQQFARCINQGCCSHADKRTPIALLPGAEMSCPECGKPIVATLPSGKPVVAAVTARKPVKMPPQRLVMMGMLIVALLELSLYFNLFKPLPDSVNKDVAVASAQS